MVRALILGGTGDANLLADAIARARIEAIYSYAGRTRSPPGQPVPIRVGGFGGAGGLAEYIRHEKITHVVDASHPFAAEISRNAVAACQATGTNLIALERAPWVRMAGDKWVEVADIPAAVTALPVDRARVFLAIGRQHIAPFAVRAQHAYVLRFVDPADEPLPFPDAEVIIARGPFALQSELELLRSRGIEWIVARNSGGAAARAKIAAARELRIPVVMIARPELPERQRVQSVAEIMNWFGHRTCLGA